MRIEQSKNLVFLANKFGKFPEFLVEEILEKVNDGTWSKDCNELWGLSIQEIIELQGDDEVHSIRELFFDLFEHWPSDADSKKLSSLVVTGDYDCPECGGVMETIDLEKRVLNSSDRDQEPEYEILSETKKCKTCGYES